jgi:uncharacterized protein (DUF4415 family)
MKPTPIKGRPGMVSYRREPGEPLTKRQRAQLEKLARMPEHEIDTSDIPELPASAWKNAVRGRFYRAVKQTVILELDADVVAWLKKDGEGYQSRANQILWELMITDLRSP